MIEDLIASLSKSEKRYFKLSLKHGNVQHQLLELYDYFESQGVSKRRSEKDKARLSSSLRKNMSAYKNQLQQKILDALVDYNKREKPRFEVNSLHTEIDILFDKKMMTLCLRKIRRLQKLVDLYELHEERPKLNIWQRKYQLQSGYYSTTALKEEQKVHQSTIALIDQSAEYWFLPHQFVVLRNTYKNERSEELKEALEKFCSKYEKLSVPDGLSFMDRINFLNAQSLIAEYRFDNEKAWRRRAVIGKLFLDNPEHIKNDPSRFLDMFYNYTISCLKTEKYDEGLAACLQIEESAERYGFKLTQQLKFRVYEYANSMRIVLLIKSKHLDAFDIVERIESGFEEHGKTMRFASRMVLMYFISYYHFINGEYKKALDWINRVFLVKVADEPEVLTAANLFFLVIHIELGNAAFLDRHLRNSLYFIKKKSRKLAIEDLVIDVTRSFIDSELKTATIDGFLQRLSKTDLTPLDHSVLYSFDLETWLIARKLKQPMKQLLEK